MPITKNPIMKILHNDLPTVEDSLGWQKELVRLAKRIIDCPTPHVLGIHGDWGSGKTSFMRQLQHLLGGDLPNDASVCGDIKSLSNREKSSLQKEVVTIWFDAWRYQNESSPIVSLLQEMKRQMSTLNVVKEKFEKIGTIAMYSVLDSLSDLGKIIKLEGIPSIEKIEKRGEKWEKEHYEDRLNSDSIRENLHKAIKCLLPTGKNPRVVVFVDDLDRCNPKSAVKLLEGLKIYMSIPNCVFILGMNERILVDAIREEISAPKEVNSEELKLRAGHYLEKICTDIYRLPLPISSAALISVWLSNIEQKQALLTAVIDVECLPPNPRRLKALANQWPRFANCIKFPTEHNEQTIWAVKVLIATYIHQFHRDIWERWHFNPNFWNEILSWCNGEIDGSKLDWAKSLKITYDVTTYDETTSQPILKNVFPNPGDIDNFWIGAVIQKYKDYLKPSDFTGLLEKTKE